MVQSVFWEIRAGNIIEVTLHAMAMAGHLPCSPTIKLWVELVHMAGVPTAAYLAQKSVESLQAEVIFCKLKKLWKGDYLLVLRIAP